MIILVICAFLLLYSLLVYYIGRSGWSFIKHYPSKWLKPIYIVCIVLLSTSFILGRFGKGIGVLQIAGAYWMAIFSLLLLMLPIVQLTLWLFRLTTKWSHHGIQKGAGIATLTFLVLCIVFGTFFAYSPVVRQYEIDIRNPSLAGEKLNIVMAADMHFGLLSGVNHAKRMVGMMNDLQPDLVLIPGDMIDDNIRIYVDKGFDDILDGIKSKYGVYASLGNHDRYAGKMEELIQLLKGRSVTILYDESITVADKFTLIGRKDKSDSNRAELSELLKGVAPTKPLILLEHQPYELGTAAEQGIDLMVSGHTHRGQIFPASLVTGMIYENDWGHLAKGSMHSIVTSGYGFWGPPIRIGSRSEIVQITVTFVG